MTPAAVCPEHPQSLSIATCTRCGRFVCEACAASRDPAYCRACRPMALDPHGILSTPFSTGGTLRHGFFMFMQVLPAVAIISFVFSVPAGLLSAATASSTEALQTGRLVNIYDGLVGLIGSIACTALFIGVAEGRRLNVSQALKQGTSMWGRVFGARFRAGLLTLLFTLLLILPGIWKGVLLAFVVEAAMRTREEDPLALSTALVQGQGRWWPVFGVLLLSGLVAYGPAIVVVAIVEGAGEALSLPSMPREILTDWVARVSDNLAAAFSLATFYGLMKTDERSLPPLTWSA